MASRSGNTRCSFGKTRDTLIPSSVSRETPGASGEANPRYPGHHATQAIPARQQVGAQ